MEILLNHLSVRFCEKSTENPIENIAAKITLFANHKNDYHFLLPLSNKTGDIIISRVWLIEEIRKEQELSIMDYSSSLDDCKLQFEISVLDTEALANTINAMYLFQGVTGVTNNEIQRYKNAQNSRFFTYKKVFCFNNSAIQKFYLNEKNRHGDNS